ncbi:MAG: DNA primase [Candidatus Bathyarchaeota archaeon]|nr:DNA primase [Candidatus Bathyarchaeota archaeon]
MVNGLSYYFPKGMRISTLEERIKFYTWEFDLARVAEWFRGRSDKVHFAVIIGRHTGIFPEKYVDDASATIIIDEYENLEDVKLQIIDFAPEGVYYDRNIYGESGKVIGQELAFDLDPENITCPVHGTLTDKMSRHQGLSFCELEFEMVKKQTLKLYEHLKKRFSKLSVVYSGRGFHIHVFDEEAYGLSVEERMEIAKHIKEGGIQVDEWVTSGEMRLIRLPYSLNGLVSRVVLPLEIRELHAFNPVNDERCIPNFLEESTS